MTHKHQWLSNIRCCRTVTKKVMRIILTSILINLPSRPYQIRQTMVTTRSKASVSTKVTPNVKEAFLGKTQLFDSSLALIPSGADTDHPSRKRKLSSSKKLSTSEVKKQSTKKSTENLKSDDNSSTKNFKHGVSTEVPAIQQNDQNLSRNGRNILFSLCVNEKSVKRKKGGDDDDENDDNGNDLVEATIVARPSVRNRSPYVADIMLTNDNNRIAIAHVPNLDMGGKCIPGAKVLVKHSRDTKGNRIGPDAVSAKFGTPKCEFITQLLYVDDASRCINYSPEEENNDDDNNNSNNNDENDGTVKPTITPDDIRKLYKPVWVGAHPSLGERIAETWLTKKILYPDLIKLKKQFTIQCGNGEVIRSDFCITHADGTRRIIEVKTVVDTDYSPLALPGEPYNTSNSSNDSKSGKSPSPSKKKKKVTKQQCIFTNDTVPYQRTGIFPWGNSNQKGPDNEPVVSSRAIHHVRELTRLVTGKLKLPPDNDDDNDNDDDMKLSASASSSNVKATMLFVIIRDDAVAFRPNIDSCPSFCKYLKEAADSGVDIIAKRVSWGTNTSSNEQENDNNNDNNDDVGVCYDDINVPIIWP